LIIGNDVWIGRLATIMPGVQIGDGAIIAAEAVVTKNVESYTIAGGNPARPIRKRFSPEIIQELKGGETLQKSSSKAGFPKRL